jgi:hypothetical protein
VQNFRTERKPSPSSLIATLLTIGLALLAGCAGEDTIAAADGCCDAVLCESDADCPSSPLACISSVCGATGVCSLAVKADGVACDDGLSCTTGDRCATGLCVAGGYAACDDGNQCTIEACIAGLDCTTVATLSGLSCDDGDACTEIGICAGATCASDAIDVAGLCGDDDPCTDTGCAAATGCTTTPNTAPCDDGDGCTVQDVCAGGSCAGSPRDCDDDNVCTADVCSANTCTHLPLNGSPCDDGAACSTDDHCAAGVCAGKSSLFVRQQAMGPGATGPCFSSSGGPGQSSDRLAPRLLHTSGSGAVALSPSAGGVKVDIFGTQTAEIAGFGTVAQQPMGAAGRWGDGYVLASPTFGCDGDMRVRFLAADGSNIGSDLTLTGYGDVTLRFATGVGTAGDALLIGQRGIQLWHARVRPGVGIVSEFVAASEAPSSPVRAATLASDGAIVWVGHLASSVQGHPIAQRKLESGGVVWSYVGGNDLLNGSFGAVAALGNGDVLVGGRHINPVVFRLNTQGKEVLRVRLAAAEGGISTLLPLADGGVVLGVGTPLASSFAVAANGAAGALVRLGAGLDVKWTRPVVGTIYAIAEASDHALWFTASYNETWLGRVDASGHGSCADSGACATSALSLCDDGNVCTHDQCDPAGGCVHVPHVGGCHDGDLCKSQGACNGTTCVQPFVITCTDAVACHTSACDPAIGCTQLPLTSTASAPLPCDDGDPCTTGNTCQAGLCVGIAAIDGAACVDGDACHTGDACQGGTCVAGTAPADCNDANPCTDDSCAPTGGGCQHDANSAPCDVGDVCVVGEVCHSGLCDAATLLTAQPAPPFPSTGLVFTSSVVGVAAAPGASEAYMLQSTAPGSPGGINPIWKIVIASNAKSFVAYAGGSSMLRDLDYSTTGTLAWLDNNSVRTISLANSAVVTFAGVGNQTGFVDGGSTVARFSGPQGIDHDANGAILVADSGNHRLRRVDASAVVTTIAGSGVSGSVDGPALSASLLTPSDVAVDSQGRVWFVETASRLLRRLQAGQVVTVAGAAPGIGGAATPAGVIVDGTGAAARFVKPWRLERTGNGVALLDTWSGAPGNDWLRLVDNDGLVRTASALGSVANTVPNTVATSAGQVDLVGTRALTAIGGDGLWLATNTTVRAYRPSTALTCDDGDVCTIDTCNSTTGCTATVHTGPCNDGNGCTLNDSCSTGVCKGTPKVCNQLQACNVADPCTGNGKCIGDSNQSHAPVAYYAGRIHQDGFCIASLNDGPTGVGGVGGIASMVERADGSVIFLDRSGPTLAQAAVRRLHARRLADDARGHARRERAVVGQPPAEPRRRRAAAGDHRGGSAAARRGLGQHQRRGGRRGSWFRRRPASDGEAGQPDRRRRPRHRRSLHRRQRQPPYAQARQRFGDDARWLWCARIARWRAVDRTIRRARPSRDRRPDPLCLGADVEQGPPSQPAARFRDDAQLAAAAAGDTGTAVDWP